MIDGFNSGKLPTWEALFAAASAIEKKGLCKPIKTNPAGRFSNTDTVDSALGAQGRSSGPSHESLPSPPSKGSYLAAAKEPGDFLSRIQLSHRLEWVPVLGGTFRLVRGPSTARVTFVSPEKYVKFSPALKSYFGLLRDALNPLHSSY